MFDAKLRPIIDPPLDRVASILIRFGVTPNKVTVAGFLIGIGAAIAVAFGQFALALVLLLLNRAADGLDGAVARQTKMTDFGGFLDIVLDFIFYSGFVVAFAAHDPVTNGLPAAFLVFAFVGTGCSFLAYAIVAARRGIETSARGRKSFYYLGGLTEGAETIGLFVLICLIPTAFAPLAWAFACLCWITTATRIAMAKDAFG